MRGHLLSKSSRLSIPSRRSAMRHDVDMCESGLRNRPHYNMCDCELFALTYKYMNQCHFPMLVSLPFRRDGIWSRAAMRVESFCRAPPARADFCPWCHALLVYDADGRAADPAVGRARRHFQRPCPFHDFSCLGTVVSSRVSVGDRGGAKLVRLLCPMGAASAPGAVICGQLDCCSESIPASGSSISILSSTLCEVEYHQLLEM
jgi:hypothetical protein